jgi:hypothetical protein
MDWPDASRGRARSRNHRPSETAADIDKSMIPKSCRLFR